jgi:ribosomal protein L11 methyltransferase
VGQQTLDFGSGSGILAVALALLGARVDAVEVDTLALANSIENSELNEVREKINFTQALHPLSTSGDPASNLILNYRVVVANILKPVLLEFASQLVERLQPGGVLILSGLIDPDVAPVMEKYSALLPPSFAQVYVLGEWRALVFRKLVKR